MSAASYKRNRQLGVTGRYTPTCFPAAFDQISPRHEIRPQTYRKYHRGANRFDRLTGQERRQRNPLLCDMFGAIAMDLGDLALSDFVFSRTRSLSEFTETVKKLIDQDYRVVVDVSTEGNERIRGGNGYVHSIGLKPTTDEETFYLRSTWVPTEFGNEITLEELYAHLAQPTDRPGIKYPFNDANISALPPGV